MKKLHLLVVATLILFSFFSCKNDDDYFNPDEKGTVEFEVLLNEFNLKSSLKLSQDEIDGIIISIESQVDDSLVVDNKRIELFEFNHSYLSDPLSLTTGQYKLVKFLVVDANDSILYATPMEGADLSYLVDKPLPIEFNILTDEVTKLSPEVLTTENHLPSEFGYSTFSFGINGIFDFLVTVFKPTIDSSNFELTAANLFVVANGDTIYSGSLAAQTNKITVNELGTNYNIIIKKSGYFSYIKSFAEDELKSHFLNPLTVVLLPSIETNLIAYYPFNGNANDESEFGNDGQVLGASLSPDRNGLANRAYYFDGIEDQIIIPHSELNDFDASTESFSGCFWVKSDLNVLSASRVLSNWDEYTTTPYPMSIQSGQSGISVNVKGEHQTVSSPLGQIWDNTWHFIVFVINSNAKTLSCYLDGELISEESINGIGSTKNGLPWLVGGSYNYYDEGRFFTGYIDDIRLFNKALSTEEINNYYTE